MSDEDFLKLIRQALLMMVDAIERKLNWPQEKRTAELRKNSR